jgi:uncharacterized protein
MNPNNHRIDYVELSVADIPAAKAFYHAAFGWPFQDYGPTYAAFNDGRLDGGLQSDPTERGKAPLVILYATDLEATLERVTAAGGKVVKPIFSFPGGRRFHFTDPAGNELAVWSDQGVGTSHSAE